MGFKTIERYVFHIFILVLNKLKKTCNESILNPSRTSGSIGIPIIKAKTIFNQDLTVMLFGLTAHIDK